MPPAGFMAVIAVGAALWVTGVGIYDGARWLGRRGKAAVVRLVKGKRPAAAPAVAKP